MSNQNIVLTSSQFNELSSFINTTKLSLEKINSLLSNLQPETQTQSIKSTVNTKLVKDPVLYLDEVETKNHTPALSENNLNSIEEQGKSVGKFVRKNIKVILFLLIVVFFVIFFGEG